MEWQPIAIAPKDGTPILAVSARWSDMVPAVVAWNEDWDTWDLYGDGAVVEPWPTHWIPIPEFTP